MKKVKHLLDLPDAEKRLTLWKADLVDEGSFDEPINGCDGVFHAATPMDFESKDPEVISTPPNAIYPRVMYRCKWIEIYACCLVLEWGD